MNETKDASSSTTIQASVVGGILGFITLLKAFGINIDIGENQIAEIIGAFAIIISAGVAIYGRITATKIIK